ncbi:hypothetical protein Tco_0704928 [Tanacetum coccineum]|uniref:ATP-dependent DNA helicase n=1 Tax=Tanacetum coccineum TaxID=301880 RepID=A0ABQ4Y507_9ASTR
MRLLQPSINEEEQRLSRSFAKWILDIGDGNIGEPDVADVYNSSWVSIPETYCIPDDDEEYVNDGDIGLETLEWPATFHINLDIIPNLLDLLYLRIVIIMDTAYADSMDTPYWELVKLVKSWRRYAVSLQLDTTYW